MRPFKQIYPELRLYSAFKDHPATPSEAIAGINIFFAEIVEDFNFDDKAKSYEFLVLSYRHSASQFIMNWPTETRSFNQFLEGIYNSLYAKEPA